MTTPPFVVHRARQEHSVPWFWPFAAAIELGEEGLKLFQDNLRYIVEAEEIAAPPKPEWAPSNRVILDLDTVRLQSFSLAGRKHKKLPVLIDVPYAGHSSTIADYAIGQSLVETLMAGGLEHVLVTNWKSATDSMKDFDIDEYLENIDTAVEHLGGMLELIGLCQGGWMSAMYTALFPDKVRGLVLAGAPIDTDAGDGAVKRLAHTLPLSCAVVNGCGFGSGEHASETACKCR